MEQAAIYCRSSKDRAEVGLDAQRKELTAFAKAKGLRVAAEFVDMELSGSRDETARPGLRGLLNALRLPDRPWQTILALDTSRIARDSMLGLFVTREVEKAGARIEYAKMPVDGSSAFGETMLTVVRAFDRLHARLSAEKGRAGSEANISKGFRAGGAAPIGYKLQHEETGATRGGQAVQKSRLVIDARPAKKVKVFLKARAAGVTRSEATKKAGLTDKAVASVIAIERNALTYAGFTVWNVRRKLHGTRDNGIKRHTMLWRPRAEWIISDDRTHEALITRDEAERILAMHEAKAPKTPRARRPDTFLLSGLLFTPDGVQWHGDAYNKGYRAGMQGRRVNAPWLESEVVRRIAIDFRDDKFLTRTVAEARRLAAGIQDDPLLIDGDMKKAERRLNNLLELAAESGDKALVAKIRETEAQLTTLREQKVSWAERAQLKKHLLAINEKDVRFALAASGFELIQGEGALEGDFGFDAHLRVPREQLRHLLTTLLERVELNPDTRAFTIRYRLPLTRVKLASPEGLAANSGVFIPLTSCGQFQRRAPRSDRFTFGAVAAS